MTQTNTGNDDRAARSVCVRCGRDLVEGAFLTEVQTGARYCVECPQPTPPGAAPDAASRAEVRGAARSSAEGAIPLVDDEAAPIPIVQPARPRSSGVKEYCGGCGAPVTEAVVVCNRCGYDRRTGKASASDVPPPPPAEPLPCAGCGYDLRGVGGELCPECGKPVKSSLGRLAYDAQISKRQRLFAYLTPVALLVVGLVLTTWVSAATLGWEITFQQYVRFGVQVVVGLVAYLFLAALWIGMDAPIQLTCLRFVGVWALLQGIGWFFARGLGCGAILFIMIPILVFVFILLLQQVMELDMDDAALAGVIIYGVNFGAGQLLDSAMGW